MSATGALHLYVTNYNDVRLPEEPQCYMRSNGWPDRRFTGGKIYQAYLDFVDTLARQAWERRGRLKVAPPYSAWFRTHGRKMLEC